MTGFRIRGAARGLNHAAVDGSGSAQRPGRWEPLLLFCGLLAASIHVLAVYALKGWLFAPLDARLYQAAALAFNYFEFGAIRRGLGGSIAYLLSADMMVASAAFHLLSAVTVALTIMWLYARLEAPPVRRAAFVIVIAAVMLRWGTDAGRTDMLVCTAIGLAAIAVVQGRLAWAVAALGVGLMVHETSFIFGLPLVASMLMRGDAWRRIEQRERLAALLVFGCALVAYVGSGWLAHADDATIARDVTAKFLPSKYVDWAIYFALSGTRSLGTNLCQNLNDPSYWTHPTGGLILVVLTTLALSWRVGDDWKAAAVAALPGFAFLSVITNDHSRWAMFALFNLWLWFVASPPSGGRPTFASAWPIVGAALLLLPLTNAQLGRAATPIYSPSPVLERIAEKVLRVPRTPNVEDALLICDPDWRDVLRRPPGAQRNGS